MRINEAASSILFVHLENGLEQFCAHSYQGVQDGQLPLKSSAFKLRGNLDQHVNCVWEYAK